MKLAASGTKKKRAEAPRPYHHGDLRQALIDAALALIQEGDLSSLSLREVARRAGVTYAAPYHHFVDKSALLAVVAEQGFWKLASTEEAALAATTNRPKDRLRALGESYVTFAIEYPAHYRVMFSRDIWGLHVPAALNESVDAAFGPLVRSVESALHERGSSEPALSLAFAAWSAVHGLVMLWNEGVLRKKFGLDEIQSTAREVVRVLVKMTDV